jgi:hypothetical protein
MLSPERMATAVDIDPATFVTLSQDLQNDPEVLLALLAFEAEAKAQDLYKKVGGMALGQESTVESSEHMSLYEAAKRAHDQNDPEVLLALLAFEAEAKAQDLYKKVGGMALGQESTVESSEHMSLYEAAKRAHDQNDPESRALIATNALTEYLECLYKAAIVMKGYQSVTPEGEIVQNGQSNDQIQENTIRYANTHPVLQKRSLSEVKNSFLIKELGRKGYLKDNYAVVVSLCPDCPDETLNELKFFSFTKALSLQATTEELGGVSVESAFVAGVKEDGDERYDRDVVVEFGRVFGKDWEGLDDAAVLGDIILIPKDRMPRGVVDLVEVWDDLAGGTFFGQNTERQDYGVFRDFCRERERNLDSVVQTIVEGFIAKADSFQNEVDALKKLHEAVLEHLHQNALVDRTIDTRVFGAQAAQDIDEARFHFDRGNTHQVEVALASARKNDGSGSCPNGVSSGRSGDALSLYNDDGTLKSPQQIQKEQREARDVFEDSDDKGSLAFECKNGHKNSRSYGRLVEKCWLCRTAVGCHDDGKTDASQGYDLKTFKDNLRPRWFRFFEDSDTPKDTRSVSVAKQPPVQGQLWLAA